MMEPLLRFRLAAKTIRLRFMALFGARLAGFREVITWGSTAVLAFASLKVVWTLLQFLSLIVTERISGDATLFFAVGRGMLNGLQPYVDLYESKPPGIFLLTAASLWATGGKGLYWLVFILCVAGIPLSLALFAWQVAREHSRRSRILLAALSLLFGSAIALFVIDQDFQLQSEAFGAFFGVIYVLTVAGARQPLARTRTAIATLSILGAIFFREPFAFSLLGAALIMAENNRSLIRSFIVPMTVAVGLAAILLGLLGDLHPYLTSYLPDMFSSRLPAERSYYWQDHRWINVTGVSNPLWLRGLSYMTFIAYLHWDSPVPLLSVVLILLWIARPLIGQDRSSPMVAILSSLSVGMGAWLLYSAYLYLQLLEVLNFSFPWGNAFFRSLTETDAAISAFWLALLAILAWLNRASLGTVLRALAAIYFATLAIAITGEFARHQVFAVPAMIAPFVMVIREFSRPVPRRRVFVVLSALTILLVALPFFQYPKGSFPAKAAEMNQINTVADQERVIGQRLDALLDRCGYSRFVSLGGFDPGYMRHSPYQLNYGEERAFGDHPNPAVRAKFFRDLAVTQLVVSQIPDFLHADSEKLSPSMLDPDVQSSLTSDFTLAAPACAQPFIPLDSSMSVYFRVGNAN